MKKTNIYILLLVLVASIDVTAQDFHLSQYNVASMYLNPAQTGMYGNDKGDYRIYVDNRSQWRSLGVKPFFTTYLAYDMPYKIKDQKIGIGAYFINNRTGPGNFNTTGFMLSGSYDILSKKAAGKHCLSTGIQLGIFYKTFNTGNLTYDVQYSPTTNGGVFDQNISSGETYNNLSIVRFDANYGLYYKFLDKSKKFHPFAGFSMSHLTRPNESFTGTKSRMPFRFVGNGGCDITINEKLEITPRFLYMNQAKSTEINVGILGNYKLNENNVKLLFGFDYRHKDAVIIHLGISEDNYALRFSYDVNNSYINTYTKGRGAWELSLIFTGEKGKTFIQSLPKFKFNS
jgi:type IX secretion system PorP/SprF family membrane protein